jgi:hypothetical protein
MLADWEQALKKFRQLVPVTTVQAPAVPEREQAETREGAPRT